MNKGLFKNMWLSAGMGFLAGAISAIINQIVEKKSELGFFLIYFQVYAGLILLLGLYRRFILKKSFFANW